MRGAGTWIAQSDQRAAHLDVTRGKRCGTKARRTHVHAQASDPMGGVVVVVLERGRLRDAARPVPRYHPVRASSIDRRVRSFPRQRDRGAQASLGGGALWHSLCSRGAGARVVGSGIARADDRLRQRFRRHPSLWVRPGHARFRWTCGAWRAVCRWSGREARATWRKRSFGQLPTACKRPHAANEEDCDAIQGSTTTGSRSSDRGQPDRRDSDDECARRRNLSRRAKRRVWCSVPSSGCRTTASSTTWRSGSIAARSR